MEAARIEAVRRSLPAWVTVVVALGALLMGMGGVIALVKPGMLAAPGEAINGAVRVYAGYVVARNLPLALLLIATLALRARGALSTLMVLTGFIQLSDAVMDVVEGRWMLVPGVLVFAVVFLVGAAKVAGAAFWKAEAWRFTE